jgi:hypothetical protein
LTLFEFSQGLRGISLFFLMNNLKTGLKNLGGLIHMIRILNSPRTFIAVKQREFLFESKRVSR